MIYTTHESKAVQIKATWHEAGKRGYTIGPAITVSGVSWTPVLWETNEDPDFQKTVSLEPAKKTEPKQKEGGDVYFDCHSCDWSGKIMCPNHLPLMFNCSICGWVGTTPCPQHGYTLQMLQDQAWKQRTILLLKTDRLSWYCDSRDRAGVERGPIILNGNEDVPWGYQERGEALECAKRNGKRLKILPERLRRKSRSKRSKQ